MTIQTKQGKVEEKITDQDVVDFLKQHPNFFASQIPLLTKLSIPHDTGGGAISLVEKQVNVLRAHNSKLKKQLDDLVHIARDNDKLSRQVNKMVLEIIAAEDLNGLFSMVKSCLKNDFSADVVQFRLMITSKNGTIAERREIAKNTTEMKKLFERFLKDMRPICGRLKQAQRDYLFQEIAQKVASVALLPIVHGSHTIGLLAIGSFDEKRFRTGMGTAYLGHMSAVISKTLERLLQGKASGKTNPKSHRLIDNKVDA